jgi:hypothetical protein
MRTKWTRRVEIVLAWGLPLLALTFFVVTFIMRAWFPN